MNQAMDDLEEEEESNVLARKDRVIEIIKQNLDIYSVLNNGCISVDELQAAANDIDDLYDKLIEEADTLSREQIIKIIRGTQPTEDQKKFDIINCKGYDKRAGNKPTDEYYEWRWMLDGIEDPDLYTIFSIIRDNPI